MAAGLSRAGPARRSPCRYGNGSFPEGGALLAGGGLAERRAVRRRGRAGVRHGRGVTGRAAPVPPGGQWEPVEVQETAGQWEQLLRREKEQQVARLLWQRQDARQERAELLAQHQQRLRSLEQQHQLEQLRELQRLYQHLAAWTEPGWGLGDLMAHGAPSWPSSPALDPNTQLEEQQALQRAIRSPRSLLFSRLNSPRSLSRSHHTCSPGSSSAPLPFSELAPAPQGLSYSEGPKTDPRTQGVASLVPIQGTITALVLLATLFLIRARMLVAFFPPGHTLAHIQLLSINTPKSFSAGQLCICSSLSL
ncbi:uncharacterized protein LOC135994167 [Caloenas nicobarica]|uniref:uncharacterized protein LOC135994167 n=1 Tax=Caloenas nicobarica TaxID=187106 RepID=UPI0032B7980C